MARRTLGLVLAIGLLATPAAAAPEVSPPKDFGDAGAVEASLSEMHRYVAQQEQQTGSWRARRAAGICKDALRRLNGRVTSMAYDAEVGEKIWRDCEQAYDDVK